MRFVVGLGSVCVGAFYTRRAHKSKHDQHPNSPKYITGGDERVMVKERACLTCQDSITRC